MKIYYYLAIFTICMLLVITLTKLFVKDKKYLDRAITIFIALSLAEAMIMIIFYYWVVTITYISPSQNLTLIPIMGDILKWMYQALF